jgi:hypothetical protein
MKKIVICFLIISHAFCVNSQSLRGYIGRNNLIGFSLGASPEYYSSISDKPVNLRYKLHYGTVLRNKLLLNIEYSRLNSFFNTYSAVEHDIDYNQDYGYYPEEFEINREMKIKGSSLGTLFQFSLRDLYSQPIGPYFTLGMQFVRYKISDTHENVFGKSGYFYENYNYDFKDPEYVLFDPILLTGFGRRNILISDRFLLDIGVNFGFSLGIIKNGFARSNFIEPNNSYDYDERFYTNSLLQKQEISIIHDARAEINKYFAIDTYIGLNYIF